MDRFETGYLQTKTYSFQSFIFVLGYALYLWRLYLFAGTVFFQLVYLVLRKGCKVGLLSFLLLFVEAVSLVRLVTWLMAEIVIMVEVGV
jgi:hypothetical protein